MKKSTYILLITIIIILLLINIELVLRTFQPRATGIDWRADTAYTVNINNQTNSLLDSFITIPYNKMGWRGSDTIIQDNCINIWFIGGGTVECPHLSFNNHWPAMFGNLWNQRNEKNLVWIQNTAKEDISFSMSLRNISPILDSIQPDYIVLMPGYEEIKMLLSGIKEPDDEEENALDRLYIIKTLRKISIKESSKEITVPPPVIPGYSDTIDRFKGQTLIHSKTTKNALLKYKKNLKALYDMCLYRNLKLILVSQPLLFGDEEEVISGHYLGNINTKGKSSLVAFQLNYLFNDEAKRFALKNKIPFLAVSSRMPKDIRYYYDGYHFTKEGCGIFSEILYTQLANIIKKPKRSY